MVNIKIVVWRILLVLKRKYSNRTQTHNLWAYLVSQTLKQDQENGCLKTKQRQHTLISFLLRHC